jgi:hypothetical protein
MPDVHCTLFEYGEVPVYMRLSLGTETPESSFQGSKGILELTNTALTYLRKLGGYRSQLLCVGFSTLMRDEYFEMAPGHDAAGQEPAGRIQLCSAPGTM